MHDLTLVFDLDGTLVDTAPDLIAATNHVLATMGYGAADEAVVRDRVSHGSLEMMRAALAQHGRTVRDDELHALFDRFLAYYEANIAVRSRPFPGVEEVLAGLAEAGARIAVCTNKREGLSRKLLGALGMAARFHAIAGRDTFPVFKPDPEHLLGAIRLAGGDPRRAIMVGDSVVDVATAKAAGIPVIGVTFGYTDRPIGEFAPDAVIDHYADFAMAVGALSRRFA